MTGPLLNSRRVHQPGRWPLPTFAGEGPPTDRLPGQEPGILTGEPHHGEARA
jgi:hypothetical protein